MRNAENLDVWKKAMALAEEVYRVSRELPPDEKFGLISQMRRAAVSVASNIAEGAGRNSNADFCRFLDLASGSVSELKTQLLLCGRLHGLASHHTIDQANEVQRMIAGLQRSMRSRNHAPSLAKTSQPGT